VPSMPFMLRRTAGLVLCTAVRVRFKHISCVDFMECFIKTCPCTLLKRDEAEEEKQKRGRSLL
jgi:hypothetical protein